MIILRDHVHVTEEIKKCIAPVRKASSVILHYL